MEIIIGTGILLFGIAGIIILIKANRFNKSEKSTRTEVSVPLSGCCGAHDVCDFDQIKAHDNIIEYYDDEDLDEYKNKAVDDYTNGEIDQFREVLYTLQPNEIRSWLTSIERRKINLPSILQSEARMLMAESKIA